MKLISHRGNLYGKGESLENHPDYILTALDAGVDVEIDVWCINYKWFLGHDGPEYPIDIEFLMDTRLWCHAKNIEALYGMSKFEDSIHYFWHQKDDYTLTSKGFIWTYPGQIITNLSICVLPEIFESKVTSAYGICSDKILTYKQ